MSNISSLIDEKDRKILVELDKNARQTDSEIAKKVRVSKQVANYRIQKLLERKIINDFYTIVNVGKLGLNSYYVFIQLEKINKKQEEALLEKLNSLHYIGWLVSGTGRWDIVFLLYADSISNFDKLLTETVSICGEHLHECTFTTLITAEHISYKFLSKNSELNSVKQTEKSNIMMLKESDALILEYLSHDARASVLDISRKTKIPAHVVKYHIKNLVKNKIIEGFKPKINVSILGYQWHLLLIQFQKTTEERKKQFTNFCKQNQRIYYVTNTIGSYNLMLDIHVKTTEEFKEVLLDLKEKFSDIIKLYESIIIFNEYKISYFPKELLKK